MLYTSSREKDRVPTTSGTPLVVVVEDEEDVEVDDPIPREDAPTLEMLNATVWPAFAPI